MASIVEELFPDRSIEYNRILTVLSILEEVYAGKKLLFDYKVLDIDTPFLFVSKCTPVRIKLELTWNKVIKMSKMIEELISTTHALGIEDISYTQDVYEKLALIYNSSISDFSTALW